ncbi:MAG: hypothetical protein J3K34DRAFT_425772 [Monoraphidium minutum]|nr:MAG: hypothetical protein J3K34DRAFT_425772 [Monoraphidium minutum]
MSEATQPLLAEGGVLDAGAPDGAPDAAAAAEAGRPRLSVAALRAVSPEQAIKLLEAHGVETLGSMKVKDAAFKQALGTDGDDVLTSAAAAPPGSGFDWRGFWGARMPKSRGDAAGKQKQVWTSDVQVVARAVAVEGAAAPGEGGLVHLVNARFQVTGDPSIFTIPAVEAVITYKWNAFARRALKAQLAFYFAWLLSFTLFTWLFQDEDLTLSLVELLETSRGATTVALQVAALAAMLPFLYQEVRLVLAYGVWRWAGVWNILDSAAYALQFAITYVHLERSYVKSPSFSVVLAVQCLLLFAKIQYYSRVLQSANTSFVDTLRTVLADEGVCYFLIFLILSFYSFAAAFHILFRLDQEADEFATFLHTTGTIFAFATGGPNFEVLWKSSVPLAASCLCFVYNFTIAIVLLNLLIAVLSDSYGRIVERMEGHFRAAQARPVGGGLVCVRRCGHVCACVPSLAPHWV